VLAKRYLVRYAVTRSLANSVQVVAAEVAVVVAVDGYVTSH
jgi:hypothetical protein